jgi:hypothetical protein
MSFDIQKYLIEKGLTRNSRARKLQEYEPEDELQRLRDQLRAIQDQFGFVDGELPKTGVGTKDDQVLKNYNKVAGLLPQRIKDLEDKKAKNA